MGVALKSGSVARPSPLIFFPPSALWKATMSPKFLEDYELLFWFFYRTKLSLSGCSLIPQASSQARTCLELFRNISQLLSTYFKT
jgi:hypothetical protein